MNYLKYLTIGLAAISLLVGCSSDDGGAARVDAGPGDIRPGGGVETRISFRFNGDLHEGTLCFANYFPEEGGTAVTSGAESRDWSLTLQFPTSGIGVFNEAGGATCGLTLPSLEIFQSGAITITITAYGDVRGAVEGTFSGMLINAWNPADQRPITDGTFTAQRLPDVR